MRTFIAIPLPEECRRMLNQMQQDLRASGAEVRWAPIPSIHLTLKFLGEADPEVLPGLMESLAGTAASEDPFELKLRGLGCFPNTREPRVAWCGVEGQTEKLLHLQRAVEGVCAKYGFPPEERSFRPHLTLGRIRGKRNLQLLADRIKMGSDLECGVHVNHFSVYKSALQPRGAVHTILSTIALRRQTRQDPDTCI